MSDRDAFDVQAFRRAAQRVLEGVVHYQEDIEAQPVLPCAKPGELRNALPASPPEDPEPIDRILDDVFRLVTPRLTHWSHPGFLAYFATSPSRAGILGEWLSTAFNVNAMLWRTSPAATEFEVVALDWLRQMMGLPPQMGVIHDTASVSTLVALAAARGAVAGLDVRGQGLCGGPRLRLYASQEAHSSVEKAAIILGLGEAGVGKIPVDDAFRMRPSVLEEAIEHDRRTGRHPFAIVATCGTTSTTSIDPLPEIAAIARRHGLWLHVDAAYAGVAAIEPSLRFVLDGAEHADSLVVNPHKWLFTPLDLSVLFTRRPQDVHAALSLVPEYLHSEEDPQAPNLMNYGIALGRRFRALKLWMVLRAFGRAGLAERIREHVRLAALFRSWVEADSRFAVVAPSPLSAVCFRLCGDDDGPNQQLVDAVNRSGEVLLCTTRVRGQLVLRLAVTGLQTEERHVRRAWELLSQLA